MPKEKPVRIPLPADEAVGDFLKVKPTDEMPGPGKRRHPQSEPTLEPGFHTEIKGRRHESPGRSGRTVYYIVLPGEKHWWAITKHRGTSQTGKWHGPFDDFLGARNDYEALDQWADLATLTR